MHPPCLPNFWKIPSRSFSMLNYLDILDRAHNGPYITEENWDLEKIAMTTKRLVKKHKIEWDKNDLVTGEGKDARTLYARRLDDERPPLSFGGSPGTPVPERMFLANVMSYMQEPLIDLATCGTLTEVDGREV